MGKEGGRANAMRARSSAVNLTGEKREQSETFALSLPLSLSLSAKPKANFENAKRTDGRRE